MRSLYYQRAIEFVALNDEPTWGNEERNEIESMISVQTVAAIFNMPGIVVADDVIRFREERAGK
jgi:hypothetical protein